MRVDTTPRHISSLQHNKQRYYTNSKCSITHCLLRAPMLKHSTVLFTWPKRFGAQQVSKPRQAVGAVPAALHYAVSTPALNGRTLIPSYQLPSAKNVFEHMANAQALLLTEWR